MASEPQSSTVQEGADPENTPVPTNAEDRKTAAALSSLEGRPDEDEGKSGKDVDTEALGKAMKNLDVKDGKGAEKKKVVKVEAADVALLVSSFLPQTCFCWEICGG